MKQKVKRRNCNNNITMIKKCQSQIERRNRNMSKQKKKIMERMAKNFIQIKNAEEKSMAINIMIAYQTGRQEGM